MARERHAAASADRERLRSVLLERSVLRGDFVLASGKRSSVYVDCRLTTLHSQAMPLIGRLILQRMRARGWSAQAVGGLTMGADPLACAVARESLGTGRPIDAFVVRKAGKGHGRKRYVEGLAEARDVRCVVLEDVCTTGGSALQAVSRARDAGMRVLGVCCMVDREQGGEAALAAAGLQLDALFTLRELLEN